MSINDEEPRFHVVPVQDAMPHHYAITCPCNPRQDPYEENVWIHNAFDGRDFFEDHFKEDLEDGEKSQRDYRRPNTH
jgi:hypothetical protein